ncbi:MAG: Ig-like domain-containing protein, partial [Bifidobacteriaceae bacterium]|nr:Ig-like domain-containing protein [Bifidobacteriaceae bacterium]
DGIAHLIDDPAPPGGTTATVVIEPSDEAGVPVPLKAGNDYRATVTVVDEDGAPVAKTPVTFAVSSGSDCILNSALQKSYTVSTSDAGQAVVTVGTYPRRATTCPLTVTVPAADRVVGSGKVLVFTAPGTLDLAKSWFTVGERTAYADGSAIVPLTVQLIDEDGDRWIGSGTYNPNLQVTTPDCPEAWAAQPVHSAEHGEYGSYVRSTEVGECAVRVYVDADYQYGLLTPQGNGVAKFVAGPVAIGADLTRVAAPEPVSVDDAAGSVLVAHVTDARGRPMSGVDVLFSLPSGLSAGSTSGLATVPVTSDADGVASLTVSAAVAGTYPVAVSVGGVTVYGSSASVEFTEAPEPGLVTATVTVTPSDEAGNPLPVSTEGNSNQYQVRVDVLDSDGAPVNGARVDFALTPTDCVGRLEHGTGDLKTSWRTTGDYGRAGFVTESIGSGSAGSCALTVSVAAADQVVGSPVTLTWFDPAGPSAADSTWALSPSSGEVWVSQEVQLAVTARDGTSAHAPVSGALVEVTLPEGLWFSRGVGDPSVPVYSGTSGSDGLVLAWVKSLAPGAYPVEVRVDGVLLDPAPVLTFKEVFLDPAASTFNVTSAPVVADGVASGAVHVELRADQLSYWPLEFDPTRLSAFGGEGSGLVVSGFVDDGRGLGLLSATFTGTEVGDWPVTVLLDGEPLSPNVSGWEVAHMVLGDPAFGPGLTRLVPPDGTAVADGSSALAVSAVVVDSLGRALAGEEVRFVLPDGLSSGGSAGGGAHPAATGPDGVASLEVTAEEPGVYQVTAVVRRSGSDTPIVNGSPLLVEFTEVPAAPTFTVSFDSLGGPDVAPVVVERGQPVAELPSVSRDGFRFEGWFDQAGGGVEAVAPFTPSADVTLFAHWAALPAFGQGLTRLVAPQDVGIAGESGVTVRAVVVDRDGSPLAGETVSFYVPEGLSAGAVAGPAVVQATTGEDGVAELVVAAGAAGSYGVTADVLVGGVLAPVVNGSPAAVVFVAPPDAGVTLTAVARCAAGKNQLAVTAFNGSAEALDVEFVSDWGSKQFANVQPGKNAFHAFTVRSTDVAAGQVQVTIRTTAPTPVTVTREVDYPDNHC